VDFGKRHFDGRRALLAEHRAGGGRWRMVGLDVADSKPAENALIYHRNREVGQVTSATWSPTAKRNIALALIERGFANSRRPLWPDITSRRSSNGRAARRPATSSGTRSGLRPGGLRSRRPNTEAGGGKSRAMDLTLP